MFEGVGGTVLVSLTGILFLALFVVNYYYQRKSQNSVDEMLAAIPEEYNKQIKANAFKCLISRILWGLVLVSNIYNIWKVESTIVFFKLILALIGLGLVVWGTYGFKSEMRKIKDLR